MSAGSPSGGGFAEGLTRREFLVGVGAVVAACSDSSYVADAGVDVGDEPAADAPVDAVEPDVADVSDVDGGDADVPPDGPPPAPAVASAPELVAPAGTDSYSDGNVAFLLQPLEGGGERAIWVGGHERRLELTTGTATADGVRFHRPSDPLVELDLEGFRAGRYQETIRFQLGDSVLLEALLRTTVALWT